MGKRGPTCSVCKHRERAAIDLALSRGVSAYALAKRYCASVDALYRHSRKHLPPQLRAKLLAGPELDIDLDKLKETESQSLLANLVSIRHRLFASLDVSEEAADSHMVARIVNQLHKNLEITGKLLGDLGIGPTTINNILIAPVYVEMRVALVDALGPYPDARAAVAQVLHKLESTAAEEIKANTRELAQ